MIVVSALGRNNGITSGARLQWAALRQLGVEAELLDATPAVRNPLFLVPHNPGSAYIFHADGPQSAALLAAVRERYDLVVLDTPPVLPVADALVLAQHADATLMVVRWEKTARPAVQDAVRRGCVKAAHASWGLS